MLKVKGGDLDKMGLLFEHYHRPLYGFFLHMTNQKEASEDMVQTVFFRMIKYRHTFTGSGEFRTWMYHLARNVMNDHNRKHQQKTRHYGLGGFEERIAGEHTADTALEKKQELKTLQMAMEKLSEADRELLVLCRFQQLKYAEIAQLLNISEGAVKVRVFRALNQLKNSYLQIAD